ITSAARSATIVADLASGPGEDNRGSERPNCMAPHELGRLQACLWDRRVPQGAILLLEKECSPALRGRHSWLDIGRGSAAPPVPTDGCSHPMCGNPGELWRSSSTRLMAAGHH